MTRPIIIIDDDNDDVEMFRDVCKELQVENEIIAFDDGPKFLEFVRSTDQKCFFILCDMNLRSCTGLELKQILQDDENLRSKCIPFLLWSTSKASPLILQAYSFNVQGFFIKPSLNAKLKKTIQAMVAYWECSENPNSIDS
jgi:CheY-like chemotaxis protein